MEYRPVTLGLQTDSLRVIEEGIHEDDWIVINGLQRARPGTKVQPQQATMSGTIEQAGTTPSTEAAKAAAPTAAEEPKVAPAEEGKAASEGGQQDQDQTVPALTPFAPSGAQPPPDAASNSPSPEEQ